MLANDRIEFHDFHLVRHGSFVFTGGVEMASTCSRNELDFVSHINTLNLLTSGSNVSDDLFDALLVDDSHTLCRYTQLHESILTFQPESVIVNIGQKAPARLIMRVGYVISTHRSFTGHLTLLGHATFLRFVNWPRDRPVRGPGFGSGALYQKP